MLLCSYDNVNNMQTGGKPVWEFSEQEFGPANMKSVPAKSLPVCLVRKYSVPRSGNCFPG